MRKFEKRDWSEYFGLREEAKGGSRSLYSEEFHTWCSSLRIRIIKLRNIRWKRLVVSMGQMGNASNILIRYFDGTALEISEE
jgi:hypothetical protein